MSEPWNPTLNFVAIMLIGFCAVGGAFWLIVEIEGALVAWQRRVLRRGRG